MPHDFRTPNRAIVWVSDTELWKLARGMVLPDGYELVTHFYPITSPERMSMGFMIESRFIPPTVEGVELPVLSTLIGYQGIVVVPISA